MRTRSLMGRVIAGMVLVAGLAGVGWAPAARAEVAAARAALAQAEDTLLNLAVQHVLAKMAFFAPWAAGGTSGA